MTTLGETIGRFRLLALLGMGGFASVYRAEDTELGREVAIKLLHAHLASDHVFVRRFRAEARAAARLRHSHIVTIFDVGDTPDGRSFLVMALLEGVPLTQVIKRDAPLPIERIQAIVTQLASAIDYLHRQGLIHRDIKPANVMMHDSGDVTPMDFGISRSLDDQAHLTVTGEMIGTPIYMAPEQITGTGLGPGMDVYALGILTYELFAGRPPFMGSHSQVMDQQRFHAPPPLRNFNPNVPPAAVRAIEHALAKEPSKRPSSAGEFAAALAAAASPPPAPTRPHLRRPVRPAPVRQMPETERGALPRASRRRWPLVASLAGVLVALALVATFLAFHRNGATKKGALPAVRQPAPAATTVVKLAAQVADADLLRPGARKANRIDITGSGSDPGTIVLQSEAPGAQGCQQPYIDVFRSDAKGNWSAVWDATMAQTGAGAPFLATVQKRGDTCFPVVRDFRSVPGGDGTRMFVALGYEDESQRFAVLAWDTARQAVLLPFDYRTTPRGARVSANNGPPVSVAISENAYPPQSSGLQPSYDKPIGRLNQTLVWEGNGFSSRDNQFVPSCSEGTLALKADATTAVLLACGPGSRGPYVAVAVTGDTSLVDGIHFEDLALGDDVALSFVSSSLSPGDPLGVLPRAASLSSAATVARKQAQEATAATPTPAPAPAPTPAPRPPVAAPAPAQQPAPAAPVRTSAPAAAPVAPAPQPAQVAPQPAPVVAQPTPAPRLAPVQTVETPVPRLAPVQPTPPGP